MSKKLKATFSRPAPDKETKPKKEPQENPPQKSVDRIIDDQAVNESTKKVVSSKKSSVEAEIESEIEVEQGVDLDQIHLTEKKSSHPELKKTKKNPRLVFTLRPTH